MGEPINVFVYCIIIMWIFDSIEKKNPTHKHNLGDVIFCNLFMLYIIA